MKPPKPLTDAQKRDKEIAFQQAQAGLRAAEAAKHAPGSRPAIRATLDAAKAQRKLSPAQEDFLKAVGEACDSQRQPGTANREPATLNGLPLQPDNLLVTYCLELYREAFGQDARIQMAAPSTKDKLLALAALGVIFTTPDTARDILDAATDPEVTAEARTDAKAEWRRYVTDFARNFHEPEIQILTVHLLRLQGYEEPPAPENDAPDVPPGKTPARRRKA